MKRIIQKRLVGGKQEVLLSDDGFIQVTSKRLFSERSFRYALSELDPESSRQKAANKSAYGLAFVFGFLTLTGVVPALTAAADTNVDMYWFSTFFWGTFMALSLVYARLTRVDLVVYFRRYSGVPVIALHYALPDETTFLEFITRLDLQLQAIHRPESYTPDNDSRSFSLS
jgi:hypothetical protein